MLLQPPERQERERVRLSGSVDQPFVRQHSGQGGSERDADRRRTTGPWQAAFDPDEQRDDEERRDVEEVPLLDPRRLGERRRERGNLEDEPHGE